MKAVLLALFLIFAPPAFAQQGGSAPGVLQQGPIANGNATKWCGPSMVCDGGSFDSMTFTAPASGFTATIPDGIRFYIISSSGLLGSVTLMMPPNPQNGQRVTITSRSAITLFAVNPNTGQTLYGAQNSLVSGGFGTWIYRSADTAWYRIG